MRPEHVVGHLETVGRREPAGLGSDPGAGRGSRKTEPAVRLLTAIRRAERFGDRNIEGALQSGLMQAALARLRRWYDERARADRPKE